jgi:hypothetical protein
MLSHIVAPEKVVQFVSNAEFCWFKVVFLRLEAGGQEIHECSDAARRTRGNYALGDYEIEKTQDS